MPRKARSRLNYQYYLNRQREKIKKRNLLEKIEFMNQSEKEKEEIEESFYRKPAPWSSNKEYVGSEQLRARHRIARNKRYQAIRARLPNETDEQYETRLNLMKLKEKVQSSKYRSLIQQYETPIERTLRKARGMFLYQMKRSLETLDQRNARLVCQRANILKPEEINTEDQAYLRNAKNILKDSRSMSERDIKFMFVTELLLIEFDPDELEFVANEINSTGKDAGHGSKSNNQVSQVQNKPSSLSHTQPNQRCNTVSSLSSLTSNILPSNCFSQKEPEASSSLSCQHEGEDDIEIKIEEDIAYNYDDGEYCNTFGSEDEEDQKKWSLESLEDLTLRVSEIVKNKLEQQNQQEKRKNKRIFGSRTVKPTISFPQKPSSRPVVYANSLFWLKNQKKLDYNERTKRLTNLKTKLSIDKRERVEIVEKEIEIRRLKLSQENLEERRARLKLALESNLEIKTNQPRKTKENKKANGRSKIVKEIRQRKSRALNRKKIGEETEEEKAARRAKAASYHRERNKNMKQEWHIFKTLILESENSPNVSVIEDAESKSIIESLYTFNLSNIKVPVVIQTWRKKLYLMSNELSPEYQETEEAKSTRLERNRDWIQKFLNENDNINVIKNYFFGRMNYIFDHIKTSQERKLQQMTEEEREKRRLMLNEKFRKAYKIKRLKEGKSYSTAEGKRGPRPNLRKENRKLKIKEINDEAYKGPTPAKRPRKKRESKKTSLATKPDSLLQVPVNQASSSNTMGDDFDVGDDWVHVGSFDIDANSVTHSNPVVLLPVPLPSSTHAVNNLHPPYYQNNQQLDFSNPYEIMTPSLNHPCGVLDRNISGAADANMFQSQMRGHSSALESCQIPTYNSVNFQQQQQTWNPNCLQISNQQSLNSNKVPSTLSSFNMNNDSNYIPSYETPNINDPPTCSNSQPTFVQDQSYPSSWSTLVSSSVLASNDIILTLNQKKKRAPRAKRGNNCIPSIETPKQISPVIKTNYEQPREEPLPPPREPSPDKLKILPKCSYCFITFKTEVQLENHIKAAHERPVKIVGENENLKESIQCPICPARFTSQSNVKSHIWNFHYGPDETEACPYCDRTYLKSVRWSQLTRHIKRRHLDQLNCFVFGIRTKFLKAENFLCSECMESFDGYLELKDHLMTSHTYCCTFCGIILQKIEHLKDHIEIFHNQNSWTDSPQFLKPESVLSSSKCKICYSRFLSDESLLNHRDQFHFTKPSKSHKCRSCKAYFFKNMTLEHHNKTVCPDVTFKCYWCKEVTFNDEHLFLSHLQEKHSNEKRIPNRFPLGHGGFKCELCTKEYKSLRQMRHHFIHFHDLKILSSKSSNVNFQREVLNTLKENTDSITKTNAIEMISNINEVVDEITPSTSKHTDNDKRDNIEESEETFHICSDCKIPFNIEDFHFAHTQHDIAVRKRTDSYCFICDLQLSFKGSLVRHNKITHKIKILKQKKGPKVNDIIPEPIPDGEKTLNCPKCIRIVSLKDFHAMHKIAEPLLAKKIQICPTCGKTLISKYKDHMEKCRKENELKNGITTNTTRFTDLSAIPVPEPLIENGIQVYRCALCGKKYQTGLFLQRHIFDKHPLLASMEKVTNAMKEGSYCEICQKPYSSKGIYQRHKSQFHGERKHPCLYCSKKWHRTEHLRDHVKKIHMDKDGNILTSAESYRKALDKVKDFRCEFCKKISMKTKEELRLHIANYHEVSVFKFCEDCGLQLVPASYKDHKKRYCNYNHDSLTADNPKIAKDKPPQDYLGLQKLSLVEVLKLFEERFSNEDEDQNNPAEKGTKTKELQNVSTSRHGLTRKAATACRKKLKLEIEKSQEINQESNNSIMDEDDYESDESSPATEDLDSEEHEQNSSSNYSTSSDEESETKEKIETNSSSKMKLISLKQFIIKPNTKRKPTSSGLKKVKAFKLPSPPTRVSKYGISIEDSPSNIESVTKCFTKKAKVSLNNCDELIQHYVSINKSTKNFKTKQRYEEKNLLKAQQIKEETTEQQEQICELLKLNKTSFQLEKAKRLASLPKTRSGRPTTFERSIPPKNKNLNSSPTYVRKIMGSTHPTLKNLYSPIPRIQPTFVELSQLSAVDNEDQLMDEEVSDMDDPLRFN